MQGRVANFFQPAYPSKATQISPARRKRLLFSYAPDWIITLVLAALFFSLDKVDGYRRVFSLEDTSLRHPYTEHERVPNLWLYIICGGVPLVLTPIINWLTVRSWWDFHNSWLGLVLGLSLTGSVTQFVKITVGRPRPDIVARCIPPTGVTDPPFGLSDWTVCTQPDNDMLRDGFRSFPSGHSSMSFAGLGFLSFYMAGKLHLFDKRGHAGKAWLALTPFCGAALVAISRTMDYRHHWHDVLIGSLLGTLLSYFSYRQYYPSLKSEFSHRPYSPRIQDPDSLGSVLPLHLSSGVKTTGSSTASEGRIQPLSNRYNPSPSPPPRPTHSGGSYHNPHDGHALPLPPHASIAHANTSGNPFVSGRPNPTSEVGYTEAAYEMDSGATVPRPGQGGLVETWKTGAEGVEGTVPRSREEDGDMSDEPYAGYRRETPPQQQQNSSSGLT